jgi:hypothetical protein
LELDADRREIRLRNPRLPEFLDELRLRNLKLGSASVDLAIHRHGDTVSVTVLRATGKVQVLAVHS